MEISHILYLLLFLIWELHIHLYHQTQPNNNPHQIQSTPHSHFYHISLHFVAMTTYKAEAQIEYVLLETIQGVVQNVEKLTRDHFP